MTAKSATALKAQFLQTDPEDHNDDVVDSVTAVLSVTAGTLAASKALVVSASKGIDTLKFLTGSAGDPGAILHGGGTDAAPNTTAVANKNFMEYRCESTATTAGSDTRAMYLRLYLAGATTGGGEALRAFTTVEAAIGTARGAHISLNFGASGSVSGLATALTGTLHIPNTGAVTGSVAAIEAQAYLDDGSDDDVTIPATHALIRGSVSGDAGNVGKFVNFLHLDLPAAQVVDGDTDTLHMITTGLADLGLATHLTAAMRINVNGTIFWIPLSTSIAGDGV